MCMSPECRQHTRHYRDMMKNKLLVSFLRWCPGALGIILRQKLYPRLWRSFGRNALIGRNVTFSDPAKIHLGDNIIINDHASLLVDEESPEALIVLEDRVFLGTASSLVARNQKISLLAGCNIGSNCLILAEHEVRVEENVLFAAYCCVGKKNPPEKKPVREDGQQLRTVVGAGAWLGVRTIVLEGVSVGNDTIIGAHSVVEGNIDSFVIAFGQPARQIAHRLKEKTQPLAGE